MSKTNLFLPRRIKVGFQNRSDTYTGQLAYIIYFDEKNKLRKEASWDSWRDKKIEPQEFDNEPTEGFVLNKKVGGTCWSWNYRQTYVRVYDPRGFEFEISVPNLLYILENTSSIKGKGLEGKFVYGWDGADLVLVPVDSPDYTELVALNNDRFSGNKIYAKDLKVGAVYCAKDGEHVVYLGKYCKYGYGYKFGDKYFTSYDTMRAYAGRLITCEKDYQWVNDAPHGDEYFFSKLKDPESIITYKSVPGRLIAIVAEECRDYADRYDILEHSELFSQKDPQSDKIVDTSMEDFVSDITKHACLMAILVNGKPHVLCCDHYRPANCDDKQTFQIRQSMHDQDNDVKTLLTSVFGEPDRYGNWRAKYEDVESIYSKLHVVHIDRYLKNGKVYRSDY